MTGHWATGAAGWTIRRAAAYLAVDKSSAFSQAPPARAAASWPVHVPWNESIYPPVHGESNQKRGSPGRADVSSGRAVHAPYTTIGGGS